jgi:cysteinyl-tRNA synthetase
MPKAPALFLRNTFERKKEKLPFSKKPIGLYTCGPTVYSFAHIGNLRTYLFEDVLERTIRGLGQKIKRVMNITDVGHQPFPKGDRYRMGKVRKEIAGEKDCGF